jgi:hypothetical protein
MKSWAKLFLGFLFLMAVPFLAQADCVVLSSITGYTVSDYHNILIYRGDTPIALIKTFDFISNGSELRLLKDVVCSYDSSVFLLDGNEVIDVNDVKKLN